MRTSRGLFHVGIHNSTKLRAIEWRVLACVLLPIFLTKCASSVDGDVSLMPKAAVERTPEEPPIFIPAKAFAGVKAGYAFRAGDDGVGYYADPKQKPPKPPKQATKAEAQARAKKRTRNDEAAAPPPAPLAAATTEPVSTYQKLLNHLNRFPPPAVAMARLRGAATPGRNEEDEGDATSIPIGEDVAKAAALEDVRADADADADDGGDDDDADDIKLYGSKAYNSHFGKEWPRAELDEARASWQEHHWQLPGLGDARVLVPPTVTPPSAKLQAAKSAETQLKGLGIISALRTTWRAAHGDGPLSAPQLSLLGVLTGYVDVLAAGTPLTAYPALIPVRALAPFNYCLMSLDDDDGAHHTLPMRIPINHSIIV